MSRKIIREWFPPTEHTLGSSLQLYNSLVDEKVQFAPAGPDGKQISWYTCGPTVYDSAHLGHARNYVTFDIIRRVMEDYFGYNILFVMNVTDVDDKIILRARKRYLLNQYKQNSKNVEEVKSFALSSVNSAIKKLEQKVSEALESVAKEAVEAKAEGGHAAKIAAQRLEELQANVKGEEHKLKQAREALFSLQSLALTGDASADLESLFRVADEFISVTLDAEKGGEVTDPAIFRAHAAKYEREFFEDLESLGCRPPDVLTRVSEFVPEIISYIEKIISQGLGYESNSSVYFDTRNFRACGHTYGKLKPWAVGSATLAAEGESNFETREKHSPQDFALWKAAKRGEPAWDSPWGKGRPGWHIECFGEDTRILTNRGFLFLDELLAAAADGQPLLYACFDPSSASYVYAPGAIVLPAAGTHKSLIDFTHVTEAPRWAAGSGAYGEDLPTSNSPDSNHLSIRTTGDHDVFVQLGAYDKDNQPHYSGVPEKHKASELVKLGAKPLRFLAVATNGRSTSAEDGSNLDVELKTHLGFTKSEQVNAFLELYGFWLNDGSISFNHGGKDGGSSSSAVTFNHVMRESDVEWIQAALEVVGLKKETDWRLTGPRVDKSRLLSITAEAWVRYFYGEYGNKCEGMATAIDESDEALLTAAGVATPLVEVKAAKRFWWWVHRWLSTDQLRLVIRGLHRANDSWETGEHVLSTINSVSFRDELLIVLLHAGYSAHFTRHCAAGEVKRYMLREGREAAGLQLALAPVEYASLATEEQTHYRAIVATVDEWKMHWAESTSSAGKGACRPSLDAATLKEVEYAGRTWCVTVEHEAHLVVVQRAERDDKNIVTKVSRPVVMGQCSAMASSVIGSRLDIHSGGEDLRFPHHDNELAQAEAFYHDAGCKQWVNFFLHSGHLSIEGLKMSKSLKNFITIRETLQTFTPRQVRLLFLLQPWHKSMTFGAQTRAEVKSRENQIRNFFQNIEVATRQAQSSAANVQGGLGAYAKWGDPDHLLSKKIQEAQVAVHNALSDNMNLPLAMDHISDLIKAVNIYLATPVVTTASTAAVKEGGGGEVDSWAPKPLLLRKAAAYVTKILSAFGLDPAAADRTSLSTADAFSSTLGAEGGEGGGGGGG
eukprot:CAMPEP_0175053726 /NCGR_PEP_ID=MMETSP0052_2-20121109/9091_1 /TAXON_ID=51329 ORGANISM="Polytomella parva, Strain SAG 63-3" /NCGR_SAMPLE_ID=MMETSP0052_2 /ASSEMBLY_ACC=CAM_ASM_000194 /LENGTH=1117 /DNA_ID=CAMNT_0016318305 /DNA_START=178 /DNA_END=3528 /DNA_ORIENTATION=-